jgi:hypothetical protein
MSAPEMSREERGKAVSAARRAARRAVIDLARDEGAKVCATDHCPQEGSPPVVRTVGD